MGGCIRNGISPDDFQNVATVWAGTNLRPTLAICSTTWRESVNEHAASAQSCRVMPGLRARSPPRAWSSLVFPAFGRAQQPLHNVQSFRGVEHIDWLAASKCWQWPLDPLAKPFRRVEGSGFHRSTVFDHGLYLGQQFAGSLGCVTADCFSHSRSAK